MSVSVEPVRARRRRLGQTEAAWLLLLPFLAVYGLFLVYPFFKGVWISLHDWNLLAVAFNPDAKEFVGLRNYERVMWGRGITWGAFVSPALQVLGILGVLLSILLHRRNSVSGATAMALGVVFALLFIVPGFHPGEEGRWFDRRFWPTVGNTLVFVAWTVPGVTITAMLLAAAMNRETKAMSAFRTLFFLSQVLSVTVVTLIWQIMFSPRQGLIANVTELFGGTPIVWLTDERFAMAAIVIATIWWSLGIAMILFLAGLQDISGDLYEAGALDNATGVQGVLAHHAAEPEAHDHTGDHPADHPAFPGLRPAASDDQRRSERHHPGARALHLPDRVPRQRARAGLGHGGLPVSDHGRVLRAPVRHRQGGRLMLNRGYYWLILALAIPAFIWLVPTIWMVSLSFQPNDVLARTTSSTALGLVPVPFTVDNYAALFAFGQTPGWFLNSVIVAVGMTLGVLAVSTTAGYALARLDFRFKTPVMILCLIGLMVPEQAVFIPLYTMFADFGWHNTYHALILPRMAVPIGVFLMMQFFRAIPKDIEEAARLDGVGWIQVFWHVMLPLARPAMMTLAILTFLYAWNDYLWPLVSAQQREYFTITLGLASIQSNFAQSEGLGRVMASGVIASLPVVILFLVFQRYVVQAMTVGGSKG